MGRAPLGRRLVRIRTIRFARMTRGVGMGSQIVGSGHEGLARRRLGVGHIFFFTVAASAPMTVLGGRIPTAFAVTGVNGVPLAFPILAVALALFVVGYAAMSRYVSNAGAFYSYVATGLGRAWGVSASFVALVAYNAVQIGLYGLFGVALGGFVTAKTHGRVALAWWIWALIALGIVGLLGILGVDLSARVLVVLVVLEVVAVAVFGVAALTHPAGGAISAAGLEPKNLFVRPLGAVLTLAIAAFIGFESGATYSGECRDPRRTVARATYFMLAFTGVLYAASAWAMTVATGPENVVAAAQDQRLGVVFGTIGKHDGALAADAVNVLLVISKRDPLYDLFTWFSGIAATGVVLLTAASSLAVIGFFWGRQAEESRWQRFIAPLLGAFALFGILALMMLNFDSLLAPGAAAYLRWVLPGVVLAAAVLGLLWGLVLRSTRPAAYALIGRGAMEAAVPDQRWSTGT